MDKQKKQARAAWQKADYATFATSLERGLDDFVPRLPIQPDHQVIDIACGSGNFALRAAMLGASVTGIDFNPIALSQAQKRAEKEDLSIQFDLGDMEALPYRSNQFDWGVSVFGIMFAIDAQAAASELTRVIKPGGQFAITSWTNESIVGELAQVLSRYKKAAPGSARTSNWGSPQAIETLFKQNTSRLIQTRQMWRYAFPYGPSAVVDFFRKNSGSHILLFAGLDKDRQQALHAELEAVWQRHNQSTDGTTVADADYLEVIGTVSE
ncbi:MAG: class I SAM-dependent methyltransferase [Chloroflexota bacterium]